MRGQHLLFGECVVSLPARVLFLFRDTAQASHPCLLSLRWRCQLLTRQRAPLQSGGTPLHRAAAGDEKGAIKALVEAGVEREAKDNVSGERR